MNWVARLGKRANFEARALECAAEPSHIWPEQCVNQQYARLLRWSDHDRDANCSEADNERDAARWDLLSTWVIRREAKLAP